MKKKLKTGVLMLSLLLFGLFGYGIFWIRQKDHIGIEKAEAIVLQNIGTKEIQYKHTKLEHSIYEVTVITEQTEYQYKINSHNGEIIQKEMHLRNKNDEKEPMISLEQAKEIARESLKENQVKWLKESLEMKDGIQIYDIEFWSQNYKYEYQINAITGKIQKREVEAISGLQNGEDMKSLEEARNIVLKHINVDKNKIRFLKEELELEDGIKQYQFEFILDGKKYEYEIDAITGEILKYEME